MRLPADFSGEHLLIETPAAAKESDAALEFADHVRRVVDPVWKFQPGRLSVANLLNRGATQIYFAERAVRVSNLPSDAELPVAARIVQSPVLAETQGRDGLQRRATGGLRGGQQDLLALLERFRRGRRSSSSRGRRGCGGFVAGVA